MKVKALGRAKQELSETVDESQEEHVLITRHGKPAALLVGVEGMEVEEVVIASNPRFWELVEQRRNDPRPSFSIAEVRERLRAEAPRKRRRAKQRRG